MVIVTSPHLTVLFLTSPVLCCVSGGVKTKVEAKRSYSNYVLPYKSANTSRRKVSDVPLGSGKSNTFSLVGKLAIILMIRQN